MAAHSTANPEITEAIRSLHGGGYVAVGMQGGWVGHQREHKWFTVVAGEVQVAVVKPDDWQSPRSDLPVARYVLSAASPQVLS